MHWLASLHTIQSTLPNNTTVSTSTLIQFRRAGQEGRQEHQHLPYDTIRDAILTCARKPTWVSLIYRTEPTTKKCKNRKELKSKKTDTLRSNSRTLNSPGIHVVSPEEERKATVGRICRKEGFKAGMKEWVGDGIPIILSMTVSSINDRKRFYS